MPEVAARSRVVTCTARPDDLAAVPALVQQFARMGFAPLTTGGSCRGRRWCGRCRPGSAAGW